MKCLKKNWNVLTWFEMSVHDSKCLYMIQNVLTGFILLQHYSKCLKKIRNVIIVNTIRIVSTWFKRWDEKKQIMWSLILKIVKSKRENVFNWWLTETEMWCELVRKKKTGPKESQIEWKAKALPIFISFILQRSCVTMKKDWICENFNFSRFLYLHL